MSESVSIFKTVYTLAHNYGVSNDAVQSAMEYYRNEGFGMEVEFARFAAENNLFGWNT